MEKKDREDITSFINKQKAFPLTDGSRTLNPIALSGRFVRSRRFERGLKPCSQPLPLPLASLPLLPAGIRYSGLACERRKRRVPMGRAEIGV